MKFPSTLRSVPAIDLEFSLVKILGRGTFGVVFLAVSRFDHSSQFAIKYLVPTVNCKRISNEINALQVIGKHPNVIELQTTFRHMDQIVLIFPYFPHDKFRKLISEGTLLDIVHYMKSLLSGVAFIHSKGLIHRDLNPNNFLYNAKRLTGKVIDLGLATRCSGVEKYKTVLVAKRPSKAVSCSHGPKSVCGVCLSRKKKMSPRAGTPGYRSPEVLIGYKFQTTSLDMWSVGITLLSLVSGCYPFFHPKSDLDALAQLISIFGSKACTDFASELGIDLFMHEKDEGTGLFNFYKRFSTNSKHFHLLDGITKLISNFLTLKPSRRISAEAALKKL